jgi:acyl-CoA synthetase (NDP forming)
VTDVWSLLSLYGVPMVEQRLCASPEEVREAARALGVPVALKAQASGLLHKTDVGAVELDVAPESSKQAAEEMASRLGRAGLESVTFTVQPMVPPGVEMIIGSVYDPEFGPVLACGAGGRLVELLKDVSVRLAPVSTADAHEMLTDLKTYPLLTGYRGDAPKDTEALVRVIERVGALVDEFPQILELDLNPVVVHDEGVVVVDARIRVGPAHA